MKWTELSLSVCLQPARDPILLRWSLVLQPSRGFVLCSFDNIDQDITIMRHYYRLRNNSEFWFDAVDDKLSTLFDVYNPATFSFILLFTQIKPTIKWSRIILQSSKIAILNCLGQDNYSQ